MLRAVSQIVTSKAAATRITTTATSIQRRQVAQSSASPIGVLPSCAAVVVVAPISRAIAAPEPLLLIRWPARLLGSPVLPHAVEELHHPVGRCLRLDVRPSARHLTRHIPAVLTVGLAVGEPPETPDDTAHSLGSKGREGGAWRGLVERAELVGKAGHRASDTHAPCSHAAAHVIDGAALHDVAVDDGTPAADLHEALRVTVALREQALLVVSGPVAAVVNGIAEEPRGPSKLVEGGQRPEPLEEEQHGEHRLSEVVPLWRAPRDVDHGQPEGAPVVLAEKVHEAHGPGGIALGGRNAAPRRTGPNRDGGRRPGGESPQPRRRRHRLWVRDTLHRLDAHGGEISSGPPGDPLVGH